MITTIRSERLVVISDLHLGNPFSNAKKKVLPFLKWAAQERFDVCINGDGLEIAQASFAKVAFEVPEFFRVLGDFKRAGREVYYVTGNHDIALEHFLEDWGVMKVSPFLNVHSGETRIRIEHGHIYDPFFVKHPALYETLTHFGGYLLKVNPALYKLWISFERFTSRLRARKTGILGEKPEFREAALELSRRGFD
ncbi:MAG: UDP-2,3-diacylglucosamine diphosphatase, partial [Proteobacteria bacterium]|nr:UDP-2,3-diacylglucosamine diphosphatase [Pseudomonadota bacterium]